MIVFHYLYTLYEVNRGSCQCRIICGLDIWHDFWFLGSFSLHHLNGSDLQQLNSWMVSTS